MSFGSGSGAQNADVATKERLRQGLDYQRRAMQEQDTLLDDVHDTVVRIGGVSSNINEELATHVDLLDDIESGIGENDTLVTSITTKARDVVDLAGGPQYTCLICSLFGTLVFLIVYALLFKS